MYFKIWNKFLIKKFKSLWKLFKKTVSFFYEKYFIKLKKKIYILKTFLKMLFIPVAKYKIDDKNLYN